MRKVCLFLTLSFIIVGCSSSVRFSSDKNIVSSGATKGSKNRIAKGYSEEGFASFYHNKFEGRKTANGEIFDQSKLTAAHKELPFNTLVEVTNKNNMKKVIVRINDRGPFINGRIIDLSRSAAEEIEMIDQGVVPVVIRVIN